MAMVKNFPMCRQVLQIICVSLSVFSISGVSWGAKVQPGAKAWEITLEVNGDANCDPQRKPEPLSLIIKEKNKLIEALSSISTRSPKALLLAPFKPTEEEAAFLTKASSDLNYLKSQLAKYNQISEAIFVRAFPDNYGVKSLTQVFPNAGIFNQIFLHSAGVEKLVDYQTWYFEDVVPQVEKNPDVMLVREDDQVILPLLIYGTVLRSGSSPKYVISFDPTDTIITRNPQNEAHDTTLCQLRKGIFDVSSEPKADIAIHSIKSVKAIQ